MAKWNVEIWQPLGGIITQLPDAQNISLSMDVNEGHQFTFTMNGFNETAKHLRPMIVDVVVYRDSVKLFRGRLIQATPQGDANVQIVSCSAVDYKALLKRKVFVTSGTYTADLETCAWNAINTAQLRSSFGITRGVNQAVGVSATRIAYEAGMTVFDFINTCASRNSGLDSGDCFEWDIDPDLVFKVYKPMRGKRTPTFLADFGGSVLSYDVAFDPNDYANVMYVQGNGSYQATVTTDEGRRPPAGSIFETYLNDGSLTSAALVDAKAFWLATFNGQMELTKSYNLAISNHRWDGPVDCWLGDFIKMDIRHGVLNVQTESMRITGLSIQVDSSGYEGIAISVGYSVPTAFKDINRLSAFMRSTRQDMLRNRALWYKNTNATLWKAYTAAVKKHGAGSYEANAAHKRWQDFGKNKAAYMKTMGITDKNYGRIVK